MIIEPPLKIGVVDQQSLTENSETSEAHCALVWSSYWLNDFVEPHENSPGSAISLRIHSCKHCLCTAQDIWPIARSHCAVHLFLYRKQNCSRPSWYDNRLLPQRRRSERRNHAFPYSPSRAQR